MSGALERNPALDVFRGISVAIMLLVDAPPDFEAVYSILVHSPWQGITIADLAFPGFVFAMGASAACSLARRPEDTWRERKGRVLYRTMLLFLLGIALNVADSLFSWLLVDGYDASSFYEDAVLHGRLFGVLQRLALVYLAGMVLIFLMKGNGPILFTALFLLLASSLGFHLYAPEAPFDKMHNISQALDLLFPGADHLCPFYEFPFDPEGLYGTVAATSSMLFGVLAGRILTEGGGGCRMFLFGGVLLFLGWGWSFFDMIGKPLWTAPYVLINAGADAVALACLGYLFASFPRAGKCLHPFFVFGRNPMFLYLATNIVLVLLWTAPSPAEGVPLYFWIWQHTLRGFVSLPFSAALYAFLWCVPWWILAECLHWRRIVLKL